MVKTISVTAEVTENHEVTIALPKDVPAGPVEITLVIKPKGAERVHALGELAESEFFGAWRDRDDITDSVEFARRLRDEGWRRSA